MRIPDYSGGDVPIGAGSEQSEAANISNQAKMFQDNLEKVLLRKRQADMEKARANAKISSYLSQMPDGVDTSKVPPSDKPQLASWLKNKHIEFGNYAKDAAYGESQGDFDLVIQSKAKMAEIESAFQNLNGQLDNFKNYKDNFLKDAEDGLISNAVNPSKRSLLASVYTDEMQMSFNNDGSVMFTNDEGYLSFNDIPDYIVKNNTGATKVLDMNEKIYNSGQKMSDDNIRLTKMKLQNITKSRDEVLSLATDDFINEGGLGILDEDLLYNPERTDELRNKVIDSYMTMFNDSADAGFKNAKLKSKKDKEEDDEEYYTPEVNAFLTEELPNLPTNTPEEVMSTWEQSGVLGKNKIISDGAGGYYLRNLYGVKRVISLGTTPQNDHAKFLAILKRNGIK